MTTFRNRSMIASAALVLGAALLASANTAQARGGGAPIGSIRVTNVTAVKSPSTVVRDHRGNGNGEGGVTVTSGPPRHCNANVCVTNSNYSGFNGRVYDHRSGHHR